MPRKLRTDHTPGPLRQSKDGNQNCWDALGMLHLVRNGF
uniref:Uncharacterized protein n=1 Tax=Arundo donax TaxID=35708 RepID=A0A0A9BBT4_ARUDO